MSEWALLVIRRDVCTRRRLVLHGVFIQPLAVAQGVWGLAPRVLPRARADTTPDGLHVQGIGRWGGWSEADAFDIWQHCDESHGILCPGKDMWLRRRVAEKMPIGAMQLSVCCCCLPVAAGAGAGTYNEGGLPHMDQQSRCGPKVRESPIVRCLIWIHSR
jgi:hypothetical protein